MAYSVMVEFLVSSRTPESALHFLEEALEYVTENPGIRTWSVPEPGAVPALPEQEEYLRELDRDAGQSSSERS